MAKSGEPTIRSEKNRTFIGHLRHSSLKAGNRTFIGHIGHYPGWPNNLRVLASLREKYVKRKTNFDIYLDKRLMAQVNDHLWDIRKRDRNEIE
jgi:hypothetical protein